MTRGNRPPTVTTPGAQTGTQGVAVTPLQILANDPDNDPLTYSATGLPSGLSIAATTGLISGTVGFTASATNSVVVTVSDGRGGSASTAAFAWAITLVNRPPAWTTPGAQTGTQGVAVTPLQILATDPDNDPLTYSATGLPSGLAIAATTGLISGTVSFTVAAPRSSDLTVSDGRGGSASTAAFAWAIT